MSRLTRKEMKRDEVLEAAGSVYDFLRDHARTLIAVVVGLVVAGLAFAVWLGWSRGRVERANEALAEALTVVAAPVEAAAPRPDDPIEPSFASPEARAERAEELLEGVLEEYGGTGAAAAAAAVLAERAASRGDAERARELWSRSLEEFDEGALAQAVRVNLIELDRAEGRTEELAQRLRAMVDAESRELPREVVLDQLARTLEAAGRDQEALETYRRLVEDHPASPLRAHAARRREALEQEIAGG